MLSEGVSYEDIALACQYAVAASTAKMTEYAFSEKGRLPVLYAGGVMSNKYIRKFIAGRYENTYFAAPEFSCDNAAGAAIFAAIAYSNGDKKCQ